MNTARRSFLQSLAAQSALLAVPSARAATPTYTVGVGHSSDPYTAAQKAIAASGQFPSAQMAGKTVIIKPNLVTAATSTSGTTTDPQVVRAAVDLALAAGAAQILIAEGSCVQPAPFSLCGYDFFQTYDPLGRIQLVDLAQQPLSFVTVRGGMVYHALWLPNTVTDPNAIFISVAKLKTHFDVGATLSMKNLVGMAPSSIYNVANQFPRQDLHNRGIAQSIIALNTVRPIHFAMIDGVWGMEGMGPAQGTPIEADLVFAGLNPAAVDLVALSAMQIPAQTVPYLTYARILGMGPDSISKIKITGDPFTPLPFVPATTAPIIWRPTVSPNSIGAGQQTTISYSMPQACNTQLQIIQDNDKTPGVVVVRTLHDWTARQAGTETVVWDGHSDAGAPVARGWYLACVGAQYGLNLATNYASAFVAVSS